MNEFVFLDTDITGTEDYDIKGQDYSNLINGYIKMKYNKLGEHNKTMPTRMNF